MNEIELHILKKSNDAPGTSRGFLYQYLKTVEKWLEYYISKCNVTLYCETDDDIKLLDLKEKSLKFSQIKCYSSSFSINTDEVEKAIYNFFILYLKYNNSFDNSFIFESNSNISRNDELLKQWVKDQDNILESKVLKQCVNKVKDIINELANQQVKSHARLINDKIIRRKEKIKNREDIAQSTIDIETYEKELVEISNLQKKIDLIICTDEIKKFIKKIRWRFEEKKPTEVIEIMETRIYNLIKQISSIQAAPNLMAARLVTEVNKKSSQEDDNQRGLDNELLDKIIGESCDEMQSNLNEKIVLYFNKINELDERVNAIEVENDENRYLPFNNEMFVAPNNFEDLIRDIISQKSIILSGEPGVGKTSIAEQIIYEISKNYKIRRIIKISNVNELKRELNKENNCLCFLEDPWGKYKFEDDSNNWNSELKYLLPKLQEGKYLIVTSRENILKQATVDMLPEVNAKIKIISAENYDYEGKKQILYNSIDNSIIWHREFISENSDKILNTLTIPFSFVRLGVILKNYPDKRSVNLNDILRKSNIEFFKEEFLKEILCKNDEVKNAGIILWILFATKTNVDDDLIRDVARYLRQIDNNRGFDLYKLTNWMCVSKWLNKRNDIYNIHPIILDALEQYLDTDRLTSADCFDLILEYYASFDYSKAFEIINHTKRLNFKIPRPIEESINNYLMKAIITTNGEAFKEVFFQVAKYSTSNDPITLLIKWLKPDIPYGNRISLSHKSWKKPCWTSTQKEAIRQSQEAYEISKKFMIHVFPFIRDTSFDGGQELFNALEEFGWDFSEILLMILQNENYKFDSELDRILVGILAGKNKPYENIIDFLIKEIVFLREYYDKNYSEKFRMADQAELDMGEINHLENIADDLSAYESGLEKVLKLRIKEQGYLWINTYNKINDIFRFLIDSLESSISFEDLKILYSICPQKDKHIFVKKVKDFNRVEFVDDIQELLSSNIIVELPIMESCINALWHLCSLNEFIDIITELYKSVEFCIFIDIVYYIWKNASDNYSIDIFSFLDSSEQIIVSNCYFFYKEYIDEAMLDESKLHSIDTTIVDKLNNIIEYSQSEIIAFSFSVLYFFQKENQKALLDIFKRESIYIRGITYQTIALRGLDSDWKLIVKYGLKDKEYKCRQYCLEVIAQSESKEDIVSMLSLSEDPSAMVREKLANLIGDFTIEEGIMHLINMIKDTRNKSINYEQPNFHVARAAAASLRLFNTLQPQYIKTLIELLYTKFTEDKVVVYDLLNVLAEYPTKETLNIFEKYLADNWKYVGISDESCPLKYASAWGILKILEEERNLVDDDLIKLIGSTVYTTDDRLSEPLLICMCILYQNFSKIFDEILLNKEITKDKILIFYLCNLIENLGYNEHVNKYIMTISEEPSYALLKLKENNEEITQVGWETLCLAEPKLKEWITSINTSHSALNFLMRCLLNEEEQAIVDLKSNNFREDEIPKTIGIFSFYE